MASYFVTLFHRIAVRPVRLLATLTALALSSNASALMINLYSGNGIIGGTDSQITFLQGPLNTNFPAPFSPADFAAARAGADAEIINPNGVWGGAGNVVGVQPNAKWIGDRQTAATVDGGSALYAIDFNNPFAAVSSAILDFYWVTDNALGDGVNSGAFLNGNVIPGISGGGFQAGATQVGIDVTGLINSGTNTLYMNLYDFGGPSGLIFAANLDITEASTPPPPPTGDVPVPAPLALLGVGLLMLAARRRS